MALQLTEMAAPSYLDRLSLILGEDTYGLLFSQYHRKPEISVAEDYGKPYTYPLSNEPHRTPVPAIESGVIVVQNIDLDMISAFGTHYDIDAVFFAHHALRTLEAGRDIADQERLSHLL